MEQVSYLRIFFKNDQYDWLDYFTGIDFSLWVTKRYKKDNKGYLSIIRRYETEKNAFKEWDTFETEVLLDDVGEYILIPHSLFDKITNDKVYAGKKRAYIGTEEEIL